MCPTVYCDFDKKVGLDEYCLKAAINVLLFEKIFRASPVMFKDAGFQSSVEDKQLMEKISDLSLLSMNVVEGVNCADEALNSSGILGCTAIGRNGVIGQTLDLYTVELALVRESGDTALYITMPPYLTLMGMNKYLAFCTNLISGPVQSGVPVSNMRRNILRQQTLDGVVDYLEKIPRTTTVNFLVTDGDKIIDVEVTPDEIKVYQEVKGSTGKYNAHTNHLIKPDIVTDKYCPRLTAATRLLDGNKDIKGILDHEPIRMPIGHVGDGVYFGSIIHVVMDVKKGTLEYRDPSMKSYVTVEL